MEHEMAPLPSTTPVGAGDTTDEIPLSQPREPFMLSRRNHDEMPDGANTSQPVNGTEEVSY